MQLGFVSAIFPELTLEQVLAFAAEEGFACVELMCWPTGGATRRYAGITHVDCTRTEEHYAHHVRELARIHNVIISGLGYYPNPLDADPAHREMVVDHLKKVIHMAPRLGVHTVNSFIGRDPLRTIDAQWSLLREVWSPILHEAEQANVRIGIENCPMLFSNDEWPGGKNLAISPAIWRKLFTEFPAGVLGLNFDPSHLIWQMIDIPQAIREFGPQLFHVHAKDTRIDHHKLNEVGITGFGWHTPKLPGLGDVNWSAFFSALTDARYRGPVCIEVEDRAYEGTLDDRKRSLRQTRRFLSQWV